MQWKIDWYLTLKGDLPGALRHEFLDLVANDPRRAFIEEPSPPRFLLGRPPELVRFFDVKLPPSGFKVAPGEFEGRAARVHEPFEAEFFHEQRARDCRRRSRPVSLDCPKCEIKDGRALPKMKGVWQESVSEHVP
jgi:hypothetical protein